MHALPLESGKITPLDTHAVAVLLIRMMRCLHHACSGLLYTSCSGPASQHMYYARLSVHTHRSNVYQELRTLTQSPPHLGVDRVLACGHNIGTACQQHTAVAFWSNSQEVHLQAVLMRPSSISTPSMLSGAKRWTAAKVMTPSLQPISRQRLP